jgi:HEAT repeat protein
MPTEVAQTREPSAQAAALDALCVAARQVALYTATHPAAVAVLEDARQAFERLLADSGEAVLAVAGDQLLWGGNPLSANSAVPAELRRRLKQRFVSRVIFRTGLQAADLAALVQLLSTDPEDVEKAGGAARLLESKQLTAITIEEANYSKYLRDSELKWIQTLSGRASTAIAPVANLVGVCLATTGLSPEECQSPAPNAKIRASFIDFGLPFMPEGMNGDAGEPAADHDQPDIAPEDYLAVSLANVIQRSGEMAAARSDASVAEWRAQVVSALRLLDAPLRARLFRAPVIKSESTPDFLREAATALTPTEAVNLVMAHPGAVANEPSKQLALLLFRLAHSAERRNQIEPLLREALVGRNMSADSYENVVGLLLDKVCGQHLSTQPLLPQGSNNHARAVSRATAQENISHLAGTLIPKQVAESRRTMLIELLDMDLQPWEFVDVTRSLQQEATSLATSDEAESLIEVVHSLERMVHPESPKPEMHRTAAMRALRGLGVLQVVQCLTRGLSDAPTEAKRGIIRLLGHLGGAAVPVLVDVARTSDQEDVRREAVLALAGAGPEGDKAMRPLLSGSEPGMETEVTQILLHEGGDVLRHVEAVLDHPDPALRRELARALAEVQESEAEQILIRACQDNDLRVRIAAIDSLGVRRATAATAALALAAEEGSLRGDALGVRMTAVTALGRVATPEAVEALSRVLRRQTLFFREQSDALRCLAARCLAQIPLPQAREALEQGLSERRAPVREACRAALRAWQTLQMPSPGPARESGRAASVRQ